MVSFSVNCYLRDRNCLMSSIILVFSWAILDEYSEILWQTHSGRKLKMILARMWQGVNIWKWFSFPFTIRDQNCVMSSVILAFWRPILDECTKIPCRFILLENEKTVLARMWWTVNVFDMIQFSVHNWRPELSDMECKF